MFTTGSKLFIGATALAIVTAIVFGVTTGGVVGWTATVSLIGAAIALAFLTGLNFYTRDGNVPTQDAEANTTAAAAQEPPTRTFWPLIGAVAVGILVVG